MSFLDIALIATTLVAALRPLTAWRRSRAVTLVLAALTASVTLAHVVASAPRWQLAPIYLAVALVAVSGLLALRGRTDVLNGATTGVAGLALVATSAALTWAAPVPALPVPSGPFAIGTTTAVLVDDDRPEVYGEEPGGPRRIVVQVFYPAEPDADGELAPIVDGADAFTATAAAELGLPGFALEHLGAIPSNATVDAAVAANARRDGEGGPSLPVVVASHGWTGFRTAQLSLYESLASHGFAVVAIDHTYGSMATVFPDGDVVANDPQALPADADQEAYDAAADLLVATYAADIATAIDQLAAGEIASLDGALDLGSVAVIGHSTGGGAAVLQCATDRRCAAVVGYDPWVEPVPDSVIGDGLDVPLLSLRSEEWTGNDNDARLRRLHAASSDAEGLVSITGTLHRDATLLPFLSPLAPQVGLAGETPPERTDAIIDEWTRRFLAHHLLDQGSDPLRAPPLFEEAVLELNRQD